MSDFVNSMYVTLKEDSNGNPIIFIDISLHEFYNSLMPLMDENGKIHIVSTMKSMPGKTGVTHNNRINNLYKNKKDGKQQ